MWLLLSCSPSLHHHSLHTDDVYDEGEDSTMELDGLEPIPISAGGGYSLSLAVPPIFFKFIIGVRGATRSNIEQETKCKLRIPFKGQEGSLGELDKLWCGCHGDDNVLWMRTCAF